jgi:hypothetical protein
MSTGMGGRSNSVAAIALKLFLDEPGEGRDGWENRRVIDILTNSVNPTPDVDFHAPFRTNVYFRRSLPLSAAVAQALFVDSFGRTGFDPEMFDLSHLATRNSDRGVPETLFFRYVGSANLVSECRAGDVFDVHSGDGTCVGLKIGRLRLEEDVVTSDSLDATAAFSHHLRPKVPRVCCSGSRIVSYLGDTMVVLGNKIRRLLLPADPSASHRLYVWLYDVTRNRNPSAQEALPPLAPRIPKGVLNVEGFNLPVPAEATRWDNFRNAFLRVINSLPWNSECANDHPSTEACQITTNPFQILRNLEEFVLDGPGLLCLEPIADESELCSDSTSSVVWRADLSYLFGYPVRPGYRRYGCVIETDGKRILRIKVPSTEVSSNEIRWTSLPPEDLYGLRVAWASMVVHVTVSQHLALDHMRIAGPFAEFVEGTYIQGDVFTSIGKLASYGTFEINYLGAPVLLYPGGLFDRLFAFEHSALLRLLNRSIAGPTGPLRELGTRFACDFQSRVSPKLAGETGNLCDRRHLANLPGRSGLAGCLADLRNGPYADLSQKVVSESFQRRTPEVWKRLVSIVSRDEPDDATLEERVRDALATILMHVTVDHYLVGRLERFVSMAGFRTTIWEMGAPEMSPEESQLVGLTLRLTFREHLDLADDLSSYFRELPALGDAWSEFQNEVRRILSNPARRIPLEDIGVAVDI